MKKSLLNQGIPIRHSVTMTNQRDERAGEDLQSCDVNVHQRTQGRTDSNNRGKHLLQLIMENNSDILNIDNKPTFINTRHRKVIDLTLGYTYICNYGSSHTSITGYQKLPENKIEAYKVDLEISFDRMSLSHDLPETIRSICHLGELRTDRYQATNKESISNCKEISPRSGRRTHGGSNASMLMKSKHVRMSPRYCQRNLSKTGGNTIREFLRVQLPETVPTNLRPGPWKNSKSDYLIRATNKNSQVATKIEETKKLIGL